MVRGIAQVDALIPKLNVVGSIPIARSTSALQRPERAASRWFSHLNQQIRVA